MFHLSSLSQLPLHYTAEHPANQPGDFPDFPLPPQPTALSTVLKENDMNCYNNMTITRSESITLERETRQQNTSDLWHVARSPRLTSSYFHRICSRRGNHESLAATIKTPLQKQTMAMKRGIALESTAAAQYSELTGNVVLPCGFVVNPHAPHLGASPDGRVIERDGEDTRHGLIEIKCPTKDTIRDCALKRQPDDSYKLKESHTYFHQVMGQLGLTGMTWCDFYVMCKNDHHLERIHFDSAKWAAMKIKLDVFFFDYFVNTLT